LAGAGLPAAVVNPALVRAFGRALGKRAKTDPIDAAVIAHFAEATGLTARPVAPIAELPELGQLGRKEIAAQEVARSEARLGNK
jgi:transposase